MEQDDRYLTLVRDLEQGGFEEQLRALEALAELDDPRAAPVLCRVVMEWDVLLRRRAVEILDCRTVPAALETLFLALRHDEDLGVRLRAARALGCSGDPNAVPALFPVSYRDRRPDVREAARQALTEMGFAATPYLCRVLCTWDLCTWDMSSRRAAASLLRDLRDPASVPTLVAALETTDGQLLRLVIEALVGIAETTPVPALRSAIPKLQVRALYGWPIPGGNTGTFTRALEKIAWATRDWNDLPRPAQAPPVIGQCFPIPADTSPANIDDLPLPASPAT